MAVERLVAERLVAERLVAERLVAERLVAERLVAEHPGIPPPSFGQRPKLTGFVWKAPLKHINSPF